jgi:hypothetical protein
MRARSLALSLAISLAASAESAEGGVRSQSSKPESSKPSSAAEFERRKPRDCHRDVRRHRIGSVMVLHRHVGDHCNVRLVREMSGL